MVDYFFKQEMLLLPPGVNLGDAWTPFISDIWAYSAFLQEDCVEGAVASWTNRGSRWSGSLGAAVQADVASRPNKLAGNGGVEFNGAQNLAWPSDQFRWVGVRCTLTVFRVDFASAPGTGWVVRPNGESSLGAHNNSSAINIQKGGGAVKTRWNDPRGPNEMITYGLGGSYSQWIIIVHYHRDGKLYQKINGGTPRSHGFQTFQHDRVPEGVTSTSYLGSPDNDITSSPRFSIDCRLEISGEPSDEWIAKAEKWAANRVGVTLPVGHPLATSNPVVTRSDFPHKVDLFNFPQWTNDINDAPLDITNRGQPIPAEIFTPFDTPIFLDDFRVKSVGNGNGIDPYIWYGIGGLAGNTVGISANLVYPNQSPDCYPYDAVEDTLGARAIVTDTGSRFAGQFSTVDRLDNGITFKGGYWLRYTFKLLQTNPRPYYFPAAPWFYGAQRSKNGFGVAREIDTLEVDTLDTTYCNGMSHHAHEGVIRNGLNGRVTTDLPRRKFFGMQFSEANGFSPAIDQGDGEFHTFDMVIDDDSEMMYFAIDDQEIGRFPRPFIYDSRFYMIVNNAIRGSGWVNNEQCDIIMSLIEVKKKAAHTSVVKAPFTARPTISGTAYVGNFLTVDTKLPANISQARIEWYYEDGYPIVREKSATIALTAAEAGKRLKAKVIPVGHHEDDEIWTDLSDVVASNADPITGNFDLNFSAGSLDVNGASYPNFAALVADIPQIGFQRDTIASIGTPGLVQGKTPPHSPRIEARGLIYQPATSYNGNPVSPPGFTGGDWAPERGDGPGGKVAEFYENTSFSTRRLFALGLNDTAPGMRSSIVFIARAGLRRFMRIDAFGQGVASSYFDFGTGLVYPKDASVTMSMEAITGAAGWYICYYSRADTQTTVNGSIAAFQAFGTYDNGIEYTGDPSQPAFRLAMLNVKRDTSILKLPFPQWLIGTQAPDKLYIPAGPDPRDITLTLVNPLDDTESTLELPGVTGDYVIDSATIPQNIIKRIVMVPAGEVDPEDPIGDPTDIAIPQNYPVGAVIYRAQPTTGTATGYSVPGGSGLAVDANGVVTVANTATLFAGMPKNVNVTIIKDGDDEVVQLALSSTPDFIDLSVYAANINFWMDSLDNRYLQVTGDGLTVQEVADKVVTTRKARNDLYKDRRPLLSNSPMNANRKAIRFAPSSDTSVYGLFFQDEPIGEGLQRINLAATAINLREDMDYKPNTPGQGGSANGDFPWLSHSLTINQPTLLTLEHLRSPGTVRFYKNGTLLGTITNWVYEEDPAFNHDFVSFALFYPESLSPAGQLLSNGALGQAYTWKQGAFKGYFCEIVTILGATLE